jgi:hypothetical protein
VGLVAIYTKFKMSDVDRSTLYQLFVKGIQRGTYTIEIHKVHIVIRCDCVVRT